MTIDQWEALPWHHQRVYMEGIDWEFNPAEDEEQEGPESEVLAKYGVNVQQV